MKPGNNFREEFAKSISSIDKIILKYFANNCVIIESHFQFV